MITIIHGNILDSPEDQVIIQQVNCQNRMGKGVAKAIYERYPFVKEQYHAYCEGRIYGSTATCPKDLLGDAFRARQKGCARSIINLYGQEEYNVSGKTDRRCYTVYSAFRKGLSKIAKHYAECEVTFAIPYGIGCGLANGDWKEIFSIIEEELKAFNVILYKI